MARAQIPEFESDMPSQTVVCPARTHRSQIVPKTWVTTSCRTGCRGVGTSNNTRFRQFLPFVERAVAARVVPQHCSACRSGGPLLLSLVLVSGNLGQRMETLLNIRAIRHLDEFVAHIVRAVCRAHFLPADLAVSRMLIGQDVFVVPDFIHSPAVRAFKCVPQTAARLSAKLRARLSPGPVFR